jgi:hypothetical protein
VNPDPILVNIVSRAVRSEEFSVILLRELAKTEPWRSQWAVGKPNPFIGFLTNERTTLATYSRLYDDIRQRTSNDRPPDEVIDDDDMLDGWMIKERRKHEQDQADRKEKREKKFDDGREIFIMAKTQAEADAIYNKNNPTVRGNIKRRFDALMEHGTLKDHELPDVADKLKVQFHKQELARQRQT